MWCLPVLLERVLAEHQHAEVSAVVGHMLCHLLNDMGVQMQLLGPGLGVRGPPATRWLCSLSPSTRPCLWDSDATVSATLGAMAICVKDPSDTCHLCHGSSEPHKTKNSRATAKPKGIMQPRQSIDLAQGHSAGLGQSSRPNSELLGGLARQRRGPLVLRLCGFIVTTPRIGSVPTGGRCTGPLRTVLPP